MKVSKKILVPVDDSDASREAIGYLGQMLRDNHDVRVQLLNVLEPMKPLFRAVSGSLDPAEKDKAFDPAEAVMIEHAQEKSSPILERMEHALVDSGFDATSIEKSWFVMAREDYLDRVVLDIAEDGEFGTIVVGRSALPWYRDVIHRHLGDQLVHKAAGRAVWVVE